MDDNTKFGLANEIYKQFENMKTLRETAITSGVDATIIKNIMDSMEEFLHMYFKLTSE